ncbi:MAG: methyltransferase domain-containing protein [Paracoccaceae bacterium]
MDRHAFLLKGIDTSMLGLEVAPWFKPIVPKSKGYNIRSLDVFDDDTLMKRARATPEIPEENYPLLEPVDYVGSATEIASLVDAVDHGQFDYVISSHNFEHLPNPIKFLQGCQRILKPGGMLIMAVPDGRACFDYYRPHTLIADWLEAFHEDRSQPNGRQLFAFHSDFAALTEAGKENFPAIVFSTPPSMMENNAELQDLWSDWQGMGSDSDYKDAHCSVFTPSSFRLLFEDCQALGLSDFEIVEMSETRGAEFLVRCVKRDPKTARASATGYMARRTALLNGIWAEHAVRYSPRRRNSAETVHNTRRWGSLWTVVGLAKNWNRRRRLRRRQRLGKQAS